VPPVPTTVGTKLGSLKNEYSPESYQKATGLILL